MGARYTRELLEEAARATTNWDDAVRWCGGTPTPGSRRYLRQKMAEANVDVSHFPAQWAPHTEERLREVVAVSTSVKEVLRRLGINPVGGNHTHIRTPHRGAGHRHIPLRDAIARVQARPRRPAQPRDTAGRQDPGESTASASAPYRSPGMLRDVWRWV